MYDGSFEGRGAWRGCDFASPEDWTWQIPTGVLGEFDRAARRIRKEQTEIPRLALSDFPAPLFAAVAPRLRQDLESGRGFVLIRGLPAGRYSDEEAAIIYWGIALHLAKPIPQNAKDEYLFSVRDEGYDFQKDYGKAGVRISRTASAIQFHTDSSAAYAGYTPDIVALLALQTAKSGGLSRIVSAQTVHNILRKERPDCLKRLYEPFYFDRRAELRPGETPTISAPVFAYVDALSIRYFRFNLAKGHETAGVPLTSAQTEALDCFENVCHREELAVSFEMQRGDMQFINNRFVLHSRTEFADYPEPERRRHMLRLWMRYRVQ